MWLNSLSPRAGQGPRRYLRLPLFSKALVNSYQHSVLPGLEGSNSQVETPEVEAEALFVCLAKRNWLLEQEYQHNTNSTTY